MYNENIGLHILKQISSFLCAPNQMNRSFYIPDPAKFDELISSIKYTEWTDL